MPESNCMVDNCNLLNNGNFEGFVDCYEMPSCWYEYGTTQSTVDYSTINVCPYPTTGYWHLPTQLTTPPTNAFNISGNTNTAIIGLMAEFNVGQNYFNTHHNSESIFTKLNEKLLPNHEYKFRIKAKVANHSTNNAWNFINRDLRLEIACSDGYVPPKHPSNHLPSENTQYVYTLKTIMVDATNDWQSIDVTFMTPSTMLPSDFFTFQMPLLRILHLLIKLMM